MEIALNDISFFLNGNLSDSMSDKEFFDFCQQNELLRVERDENKQIIIMAPANSSTGSRNASLLGELIIWNKKQKSGVCFDSATGFTLPDGSVRSPDVSWIVKEKWNRLSDLQKDGFAPICPDFVIELKSKSDNLKLLTSKMHKWIENGCALAWLINPDNKTAFIFRKNGSVDKVDGFGSSLSGENVLLDFELKLSLLDS